MFQIIMPIWKAITILRTRLKKMYEKKTEGARIRSKCMWYEEGEKSWKFSLNLENVEVFKARQKTYCKQPRNYASEQDSK